jgi:hypothetical protein
MYLHFFIVFSNESHLVISNMLNGHRLNFILHATNTFEIHHLNVCASFIKYENFKLVKSKYNFYPVARNKVEKDYFVLFIQRF